MKDTPMGDHGPHAEFTALYRANYGRVLRFVARRIGDSSLAEDVTAEVFRIAWDKARAGTALSPGWLFVTARNTLRNHHRSAGRSAQLHSAAAVELRARSTDSGLADAVHATLDGIEPKHRDVLVLRYWDGMSTKEIAAQLEVSVSAVWVRVHRARRAFQASFKAVSEDEHAHR